jgi:predicted CopG family antitoxin
MKKRVSFTVDEEVYDDLQAVPRGVSVSEVINWLLKSMIEDIKLGREMTQKEFDEWIESTPEGKDYRNRFIDKYGHLFKRLKYGLNASDDKKVKVLRKAKAAL